VLDTVGCFEEWHMVHETCFAYLFLVVWKTKTEIHQKMVIKGEQEHVYFDCIAGALELKVKFSVLGHIKMLAFVHAKYCLNFT